MPDNDISRYMADEPKPQKGKEMIKDIIDDMEIKGITIKEIVSELRRNKKLMSELRKSLSINSYLEMLAMGLYSKRKEGENK